MKTILVLIFLLVSTQTFANSYEWLNEIPVIRFAVGNGPGTGNEAADIAIMYRLRRLGYAGLIEVIVNDKQAHTYAGGNIYYTDEAIHDVQKLLPWAKFDSEIYDHGGLGKVRFATRTYFKDHPNEFAETLLGIGGESAFWNATLGYSPSSESAVRKEAAEEKSRRAFKSKFLLRLPPLHWHETYFVMLDHEGKYLDWNPLKEAQLLPLRTYVPQPENLQEFVTSEEPNLKKAFGLLSILSSHREIQAYYPYSRVATLEGGRAQLYNMSVLSKLNEDLRYRPGVVILNFGFPDAFQDPATERQISDLYASNDRFTVSNIEDGDLSLRLQNLKRGDVLLVKVGAVAQPIFNYLYAHSTLPVPVHGKNTLSLVLQEKRPFFLEAGTANEFFAAKLKELGLDKPWRPWKRILKKIMAQQFIPFTGPDAFETNLQKGIEHYRDIMNPSSDVSRFYNLFNDMEDKLETTLNLIKPQIQAVAEL